MRFSLEQSIAAPRDAVEAAFLDPGFYAALGELSAIRPPEVLEQRVEGPDGNLVHLRVQYAFAGNLSGPARAVLDPDRLTWVDHSTFDRGAHRIDFEIVPDHYADRLQCEGWYRFEPDGEQATRQLMGGDLRVRYPVVGGLVERAIIVGMRQHLGEEARILERWLRDSGQVVRDKG
ncbi:MAG TPA: DUF2505 family protein [Acidimicrobiales bacterium]|nr:DUF2505 family protein [Acidimicrobiales bacterium]